jgi:release factor glutamine methyltransferase
VSEHSSDAEPGAALSGRDLDDLPLAEALREAARRLKTVGIESGRADAELLVAHLVATDRGGEVSRGEVMAGAAAGTLDTPKGFDQIVAARASRVPLQHLTGRAYFRNLTLHVGPGVFIPRPETEVLIDHVNAHLRRRAHENEAAGRDRLVAVDLATGSGALALSMSQENPGCEVYGVELSRSAAEWATRNTELTGLPVSILVQDATRALPGWEGRVDVVVSNPPYIPTTAVPKDPEVADHDPSMALYGGSEDGLAIPKDIAQRASELVRPGGLFVMEHAEVQAEAAARMFSKLGFHEVETIHDLTGRPRATKGYSGV